MADEFHIAQLIARLLRQDSSAADELELETWIDQSPANREFMEKKVVEEEIVQGLKTGHQIDKEVTWRKFQQLKDQYILSQDQTPFIRRRLRYAAAAVLLGLISLGLYQLGLFHKKETPAVAQADGPRKKPVGSLNKALLTLQDGSGVRLDTAAQELVAEQGEWQAYLQKDGRLAYTRNMDLSQLAALLLGVHPDSTKTLTPASMAYNILTVPSGATQAVELPDGTDAFLNTGSSLRYPLAFSGGRREVELSGQAWFEVKKDGQPFIVQMKRQTVEVLGTRFAVRDYPNEPWSQTVLQDGKVKVIARKGAVELRPGQQAQIDTISGIRVISDVQLESAFAWKAGYFNFDDLDIRAAIWQLAQWYGMQVSFEKNVKRGTLGYGNIQHGLPLPKLLKDLELPDLHFEIRDSTIIVKR